MYVDVFFADEPEDKTPFDNIMHIEGLFWHGILPLEKVELLSGELYWGEIPPEWKRPSGEPWHTYGGVIRELQEE